MEKLIRREEGPGGMGNYEPWYSDDRNAARGSGGLKRSSYGNALGKRLTDEDKAHEQRMGEVGR